MAGSVDGAWWLAHIQPRIWNSDTPFYIMLLLQWHVTVGGIVINGGTAQCRYNAVNLLPNRHKRLPIARPRGRAMGCILWVESLIYVLPLLLRDFTYYHEIFDRVITVPGCVSMLHYSFISIRKRNKNHKYDKVDPISCRPVRNIA